MVWTNNNIIANLVIVEGSNEGVYVYTGSPALGNPPIAWISPFAALPVDPYGNSLPIFGIGAEDVNGNWSNLGGSTMHLGRSGQSSSLAGAVDAIATGILQVRSNIETVSDSAAAINLESAAATGNVPTALFGNGTIIQCTQGTAANPTNVTTDTWQNMTLLNSWSSSGSGLYAQYMRNPNGTVSIRGLVTAGTLTNGTTIWNAPSAPYINSSPGTQSIPAIITGGSGTPGFLAPRLGMSVAGSLFIENIPAGTTQIAFHGVYSLT